MSRKKKRNAAKSRGGGGGGGGGGVGGGGGGGRWGVGGRWRGGVRDLASGGRGGDLSKRKRGACVCNSLMASGGRERAEGSSFTRGNEEKEEGGEHLHPWERRTHGTNTTFFRRGLILRESCFGEGGNPSTPFAREETPL